MKISVVKKRPLRALLPVKRPFFLGPVSAFSLLGDVNMLAATLFHEEYDM